jgi:hypothetical protein
VALLTVRRQIFDEDSEESSDSTEPNEEPAVKLCLEHEPFGERWNLMPDDDKDPSSAEGRSLHVPKLAEEWTGQTMYLLLAKEMDKQECYVRVGVLFRNTAAQRKSSKFSRKTFKIV